MRCFSLAKTCSIGFIWANRPGGRCAWLRRREWRLGLLCFCGFPIVERDDVSWPQRRDATLLDIGEEPRAIDRAVKDAWRFDPAAAQRGHKG